MIISDSYKIGSLLLTFQKKKLYYNRISESQLYLPYRVLTYFYLWVQLGIEQNQMVIKRSFLLFVILVTLMGVISNQKAPLISKTFLGQKGEVQIEMERQAKNIPNLKKDTMPFYQFKQRNKKTYSNSQEEVYRSIVYIKNQQKVNGNNQKLDRKFNMVVNRFADLTPMEFSQKFTNLYKSNEKIKGYTKNLIDSHHFFDPTNNLTINQSDFISNNHAEFTAVRDSVLGQIREKNDNIIKQSSDFTIVEEVFAGLNPSTQIRQNRNAQLHNLFESQLSLKPTTNPSLKGLNFTFGSTGSSDAIQASFQQKMNQIIQSKAILQPLKLTNDTTLTTSTSSSASSSSLGNFSSIPIDWTIHAGKIRYQGICGACYTFATSDVLSSIYSIYKFGFFVPLSTQQVVDCSTNGLTYGCNGGFLEGSYAYMQIKGIQTDSNYPYTSAESGISGRCKKDGGTFKVASFKNIEQGNCKAMVNQLNYGPVSIGIAGYRLQFYSSGIFNDCNNYVDHAVVLIAYKSGVGWKIKNSWGPDWGMSGFAWIADGNNCGICDMGVSARV